MSVTYEAILDVSEESVAFLSGLLDAERVNRGTRDGTRALSTHDQAVLVLRWFLDPASTLLDRQRAQGESHPGGGQDHQVDGAAVAESPWWSTAG